MQKISKYNHSCAWEQDQFKVTYKDLLSAVDDCVKKWNSNSSRDVIQILNSADQFECAVGYLAAWLHGWCVSVIPSGWPDQMKKKATQILKKYKNENYFYVLPTSGSSGIPKWVPITRSNWGSFFNSASLFYDWKSETRVALTFEPAFDPFVAMVFMTWFHGATLIPMEAKHKFSIFDFCLDKKINVWASVPSLVELNWLKKTQMFFPDMQLSLFTGEILTPELVQKWLACAAKSQIENLYGPVETTVWVTRHVLDLNQKLDSIPIGQALANVELQIENNGLIIGGPQVSPGYLTEAGPISFNDRYATKDRAQFKNDQWWFQGRLNEELKWAGQRINLGEIEKVFQQLTGAICIAFLRDEIGVGLITSQVFDAKKVFQGLRENLTSAALPRNYFYIKDWPLNSSGKIDRQKVNALIDQDKLQKVNLNETP